MISRKVKALLFICFAIILPVVGIVMGKVIETVIVGVTFYVAAFAYCYFRQQVDIYHALKKLILQRRNIPPLLINDVHKFIRNYADNDSTCCEKVILITLVRMCQNRHLVLTESLYEHGQCMDTQVRDTIFKMDTGCDMRFVTKKDIMSAIVAAI
eukprot:235013_1